MKRNLLLGIGLVILAAFVFGTTTVTSNAETKPPQPVGVVYLPEQ